MSEPLRILFLEDDAADAELVLRALKREGLPFTHRRVATETDFERELAGFAPHLVLSDYSIPGYSGLGAIELVAERARDTPVIIVTGTINEETAVACMRAGAADYVLKDRLARLPSAVEGALDRAHERQRRREAEDALRRSEADYRSLVDNAVFGILRTDPDGRLQRVNPALVAMLGYGSAEQLLAADHRDAVYDEPGERRRLVELLRSERLRSIEVAWRRKGGDRLTVRLSGRQVTDGGGRLEGFEIIAEDVTERKRLEGQLRQAQKMEAVGQLTGGIAHDFNNILTVIAANAELVAAMLPGDTGDLRAGLDDVRAAAQRGTAMIKKLMSFSRQTVLERKPVKLHELFADVGNLLRRLLPEHIAVDIMAPPDVGLIRADPGAVEQMLLNLATNARDAMPAGGRFRIDAARTHLDAGYLVTHPWCLPGDYACISVSDTGVGMDRETEERIFEPFFTTKPPGVGTGLGMSMVYGLMKQHGGYVNVYSEPGAGTVVKLYFPADASAAASQPGRVEPPAVATGGTGRILVVEDEEAIRRAAKRALERGGYTVHVAADGEEALEILRTAEEPFDLVLSDLVMPKLGGRQLYDALRKDGITVPFLFTSGYSPQAVHQRVELPEGRLLHKPWTVRELLARVRTALEGGNK